MSAERPDLAELWDFQRPDETETRFRELLSNLQSPDDTGYYTEVLTQIARTEGLQGKFEAAHATLDEAEKLVTPQAAKARLRYLLERGRVFNSSGEPAKAVPLFRDAWEFGQSTSEDGLTIDAAHMVAIAKQDAPDEALDWNLRALEYAEQSSSPGAQKWLGALYNNIGWTYFDREEYEKALEIHEKALAWRQSQGDVRSTLIAEWSVARMLRALGRTEEALERQTKLEAAYRHHGLDPDGYVFEELGECHLALGRPGHEAFFARAYELLSKDSWLVQNEAERVARIRQLGGVE